MILAIDTSSTLCAACVWDAQTGELGRAVEDIGKGHAERLMAVIDAALAAAGKTYSDISKVAVSIGPGSFTGIRVGVSAARGLALALGVEAVGVTTLAAIAEAAMQGRAVSRVIAAIDAKRGELYVLDGDGAPAIVLSADLVKLAIGDSPIIAGSGAQLVAEVFAAAGKQINGVVDTAATTADIAIYARLAALGHIANSPPKPLYLRGPDAKPQHGFALPRAGGQ